MTLVELQAVLGDRIRLHAEEDPDKSQTDRSEDLRTSDTIAKLAKQMINNADIMLRTDRAISKDGCVGSSLSQVVGLTGRD